MLDLEKLRILTMQKPSKPNPDFPLFPHSTRRWAKKIKGKFHYFGPWNDPEGSLRNYHQFIGKSEKKRIASVAKPAKPRPDFPLYPHNCGQWAKKVRGRVFYFGPWEDPQAAFRDWVEKKDDLLAGRDPVTERDRSQVTLKYLIDRFLSSKKAAERSGDIASRTFADYEDICKRLVKIIDKSRPIDSLTPDDFEKIRSKISKNRGPTSLANDITRIRVLFKYGHDQELLEKPARFGQFKKPSKSTLRRARIARGPLLFDAEQIKLMAYNATVNLRAMILLGINCGFGNNDCAKLPISALDLKTGWVDFPRPKTAIERRCPLWPETIEALKEVLENRRFPRKREHGKRVFVTSKGNVYDGSEKDQPISKEMSKLQKSLGIFRKGVGFYALRHTFLTVAEAQSEAATKFIMGHAPPNEDMSAIYREQITDDRLLAVTNYVRDWLFKQTPSQAVAASVVSSDGGHI